MWWLPAGHITLFPGSFVHQHIALPSLHPINSSLSFLFLPPSFVLPGDTEQYPETTVRKYRTLCNVIPSSCDREQYLCLTWNLAWISESDSIPDYCLHWVKWAATMPDGFFSCSGITWLPQTRTKEKYLFHGKRWAGISTPCTLNLESRDLII